jgi:hypothetical protein
MIDPLTSLSGRCHPLGNELQLLWGLPGTLPTNYRIACFKSTKAITDEQIEDYFAGEETDVYVTFFEPDGAGNMIDGIDDMNVDTGKHYYYRMLIQDTDSQVYSETVNFDIVIASTFTATAINCKALVTEAMRRIMNNYGMIENKDYELRLQWTIEAAKAPVMIHVVSAPNQVAQRYMGDSILNTGGQTIQGQIDVDNIEVVWEDASLTRIDTLTQLFRGSRGLIKRYLNANGITDVEIVMGGDSINAVFKDRPQPVASMMVQCTFEVQESYEYDITNPVSKQELTIENC